jgi:acyl dehydratase
MLPEEIKNLVGKVFSTSIFEIEKESIRRFADAVGDRNPLYRDEEYAGKSRYGSIIAPPGYISSVWFWEDTSGKNPAVKGLKYPGLLGLMLALAEAGYRSVIDSGIDYEFFQPVRAGDTIKSEAVIKDIRERKSEDGNLIFLITDTTYTNQNGEDVAKTRWTTIHR